MNARNDHADGRPVAADDRPATSDDRLGKILGEYLDAHRAGTAPPTEAFLREHPELAADLSSCLASLSFVQKAGVGPAVANRSPAAKIPPQIGDYRIVREIGRGGMGVVYEAEQRSLSRQVALKVILANGGLSRSQVERFQREAEAAARLHHPNIVPVYDVGRDHERHFYAMQYIEGASLDRLIAQLRDLREQEKSGHHVEVPSGSALSSLFTRCGSSGKIMHASSDENSQGDVLAVESSTNTMNYFRNVARLFAQAADALDYAHREGIVHRDVKPSNFILDITGHVWLVDFGLAKVEESNLTQTNDVLGTLRYMAPEYYRGECTRLSDLFGLGLTMFETLALRPAYDAIDRTTLVRQVTVGEIRSLREIVGIPHDLDTIVMKLLRPDPPDRYVSGLHVCEDLERFVDGLPILARPVGPMERTWRWCKQNQIAAMLGALACLLVVAIAVGSSFGWAYTTKQSNTIRRNLYAAQMVDASNAAKKPAGLKRVTTLVDQWRDADDLKGWEWYYLASLSRRDEETLIGHTDAVYTVCWNNEGNQLLSASQDGTAKLWSLDTGKVIRTFRDHQGSVRAAFWNPAGTKIAAAGHDGVIVVRDVATDKIASRLEHESPINTMAWSPNGREIAAGYVDATIVVWDVETGQPTELVGHKYSVMQVAWHPNGRELASCAIHEARVTGCSFRRWDLVTSTSTVFPRDNDLVNAHDNSVYSVSYRADGQIVSGGGDGIAIRWDPQNQPICRFDQSPHIYCVRWFSGNRICSAGADHTIRIWDADAGQQRQSLRGHLGAVRWIQESPCEPKLASASVDGTIKVWPTTGPHEVLEIDDREGFAWGANSDQFVSCRKSTTSVTIFDILGNPLSEFTLEGTEKDIEFPVDWSPDGSKIAAFLGGNINVIDVQTQQQRTIATNQREPSWIQWCNDNRRVLLLDSGSLYEIQIYDTSSGQLVNTIRGRCTGYSIRWSPCGKYIAGTSLVPLGEVADRADLSRQPTGPVKIWDAETGDEVATFETNNASGLAYHPSGTQLAAVCDNDVVEVWDVATCTKAYELKGQHGWIGAVDWSHDGRRLAVGGGAGNVKIWDPDRQLELVDLETSSKPVVYLEWSPDDRKLASWSWGSRVHMWDASSGYDNP